MAKGTTRTKKYTTRDLTPEQRAYWADEIKAGVPIEAILIFETKMEKQMTAYKAKLLAAFQAEQAERPKTKSTKAKQRPLDTPVERGGGLEGDVHHSPWSPGSGPQRAHAVLGATALRTRLGRASGPAEDAEAGAAMSIAERPTVAVPAAPQEPRHEGHTLKPSNARPEGATEPGRVVEAVLVHRSLNGRRNRCHSRHGRHSRHPNLPATQPHESPPWSGDLVARLKRIADTKRTIFGLILRWRPRGPLADRQRVARLTISPLRGRGREIERVREFDKHVVAIAESLGGPVGGQHHAGSDDA
jgi:hypothetical protein